MKTMKEARLPGAGRTGPEDEKPGGRLDGSTVPRLLDMRPRELSAWASACHHLRSLGLEPLPPVHVVRALHRRGWWL